MIHWLKFNAVGALGFALQAFVLFVLTSGSHQVHYLAATVLAVELAVLHNFAWHQCWTWSDRRTRKFRRIFQRLVKFNTTNGLVSIAGNLMFMSIFAGALGLPVIYANAASVACCSICNFLLADQIVFRHSGTRRLKSCGNCR